MKGPRINCRRATLQEKQEIAEFLAKYWGDAEEWADILRRFDDLPPTVIDKYMSDGPGYCGPVYFVVFGGGPEFHLVLTRHSNELEIVASEFPHHGDDPGECMSMCPACQAADEREQGPHKVVVTDHDYKVIVRDDDYTSEKTYTREFTFSTPCCATAFVEGIEFVNDTAIEVTCPALEHDPGCTGNPERCDCLPDDTLERLNEAAEGLDEEQVSTDTRGENG